MITARLGFKTPGAANTNETGALQVDLSSAGGSLELAYDATSDTYTMKTTDLVQTLKLGQPTATANGGTARLDLFAGAGGTKYVRMGEWSNILTQAGNTDFRYDLFAFGMKTPNAGLVRTGSAGYAIDVRGIATNEDGANALRFSGTGSLLVDLLAGQMHGSIPLAFTEDYTGGLRPPRTDQGLLNVQARIGSNDTQIGGAVDIWGGAGAYYGWLYGDFFGPSAEEAGGRISARGLNPNPSTLVGTFAGTKGAAPTDPDTQIKRLADLAGPTVLGFERVVPNGTAFSVPRGLSKIEYDPATGTYRVSFPEEKRLTGSSGGIDNFLEFSAGTAAFSAATKDATQPLTGFDAHTALIGSQKVHAYFLRPDNPYVQLSYVSIAGFALEPRFTTGSTSTVLDAPQWFRSFAYFGNRSVSVPTTGTASYTGAVLAYGTVNRSVSGVSTFNDIYDVSGRASLTVNFADQTFSAVLDQLVGTRTYVGSSSDPTGATFNFGTINQSGILADGRNLLGQTTGYDRFFGSFFGPRAAEFAILFEKRFGTPLTDPLAWHLTGVAAGKKN